MTQMRIGTAGWSIPRPLADRFPPGDSVLARYAQTLDCVEINSSFYRPHKRATYERWAASVPQNFRFAAKLPRTITHQQRLELAGDDLAQFLEAFGGLGDKRGPLLIQLPPSLAFDATVVRAFLTTLRDATDGALACEPRHASWFEADAEAVLRAYRVARVAADPARVPAAAIWGGWPGLRYLRLHGSPRIYYSDYAPDRLAEIAARLVDSPCETWCMFDNTASGAATANALDVSDRLR